MTKKEQTRLRVQRYRNRATLLEAENLLLRGSNNVAERV